MKKTTKIWLLTAALLVLAGCILFAGVMAAETWDFGKLSTVRYETNIYPVSEPFHDLSLTTDTADIVLLPSTDGKIRVECREEENAKHTVTVENDTLTVKVQNNKTWRDYIGFDFGTPKITVYLPETAYGALIVHENTGNVEISEDFVFESADISVTTGNVRFLADTGDAKIKTSTGDIQVEDLSADSLDLSVTTGKITASGVTCRGDVTLSVSTGKTVLSDVTCENLLSTGTTGTITLERVLAANRFSIERSTGDVKFTGCDAAELSVKTGTGDVTGTLLTEKVFLTDTGTGWVEVPRTAAGGKCQIKTGTGNIRIKIEENR